MLPAGLPVALAVALAAGMAIALAVALAGRLLDILPGRSLVALAIVAESLAGDDAGICVCLDGSPSAAADAPVAASVAPCGEGVPVAVGLVGPIAPAVIFVEDGGLSLSAGRFTLGRHPEPIKISNANTVNRLRGLFIVAGPSWSSKSRWFGYV